MTPPQFLNNHIPVHEHFAHMYWMIPPYFVIWHALVFARIWKIAIFGVQILSKRLKGSFYLGHGRSSVLLELLLDGSFRLLPRAGFCRSLGIFSVRMIWLAKLGLWFWGEGVKINLRGWLLIWPWRFILRVFGLLFFVLLGILRILLHIQIFKNSTLWGLGVWGFGGFGVLGFWGLDQRPPWSPFLGLKQGKGFGWPGSSVET